MSVPGGSRGHFAAGADVVVAGSSATYELKVFGAGGELRHIIRNSIPAPAELRLVERARPSRDRPSEGGGSRRTLEPPSVETAPAYDWVFVANDGTVWVRHLAGPDEESLRTDIAWSSAVSSSTGPLWVAEGLQGQEWHVYEPGRRAPCPRPAAAPVSPDRDHGVTGPRCVGGRAWRGVGTGLSADSLVGARGQKPPGIRSTDSFARHS